jgi:hypothetical protein
MRLHLTAALATGALFASGALFAGSTYTKALEAHIDRLKVDAYYHAMYAEGDGEEVFDSLFDRDRLTESFDSRSDQSLTDLSIVGTRSARLVEVTYELTGWAHHVPMARGPYVGCVTFGEGRSYTAAGSCAENADQLLAELYLATDARYHFQRSITEYIVSDGEELLDLLFDRDRLTESFDSRSGHPLTDLSIVGTGADRLVEVTYETFVGCVTFSEENFHAAAGSCAENADQLLAELQLWSGGA